VLAGALLSASQLAGVAGRLGWGFIADRVASSRVLLLGIALLMAVAAGLMSQFTSAWPLGAIAAVVVLLGATASGWNGVFLAEIIRDVRPAEVSLATAGSMMFAYMGTVLGPSLFGGLANAAGFSKAYLVMGAAVLLGGIIGAFGHLGRSDKARARSRAGGSAAGSTFSSTGRPRQARSKEARSAARNGSGAGVAPQILSRDGHG